ncbi:MAG: glycosyltransferase family 2 protein [Candidatus Aminicenantes bacterium]|nr:glycosyltransferase family 2 protein [Candidatus Aminicenantes bacterium]RLE04417.1 MAG: glycosyltransferase family 2 protein [Candidatus Aminicenantes bacterium]
MKISIIIPTYNRAPFLAEALESVIKQTVFPTLFKNQEVEILVIDDGSEDNTRKIVEQFKPYTTYLRQPHRGVSAARNHGLQRARGELIAYLDSDDLWLPEKLAVQLSFMKAFPRCMVCYTEEIWLRHGRRVNPKKKHQKYSGWIFDKVLPLCLLSLSSAMFRRQLFEEIGFFDESLPAAEDYDLGIRAAHRYPIHLIERPLIIKRGGHSDQLSHKYWGMDRFRIKALQKALSLQLTPEQERLVRLEIIHKAQILVQGFQKRGKNKEAIYYKQLIQEQTAKLKN